METLPVFSCCCGETNEPSRARFRAGGVDEIRMRSLRFSHAGAAAACSSGADQRARYEQPALPAPSALSRRRKHAPPAAPPRRRRLPDDRKPLEEPNGPIDPKSAEAAGQVVQHYGALIEQGRFAEAAKLGAMPARGQAFAATPRANSKSPGNRQARRHGGRGWIDLCHDAGGILRQDASGTPPRRPSRCAGSTMCRDRPRHSGAGTSSGSSGRARGCQMRATAAVSVTGATLRRSSVGIGLSSPPALRSGEHHRRTR